MFLKLIILVINFWYSSTFSAHWRLAGSRFYQCTVFKIQDIALSSAKKQDINIKVVICARKPGDVSPKTASFSITTQKLRKHALQKTGKLLVKTLQRPQQCLLSIVVIHDKRFKTSGKAICFTYQCLWGKPFKKDQLRYYVDRYFNS